MEQFFYNNYTCDILNLILGFKFKLTSNIRRRHFLSRDETHKMIVKSIFFLTLTFIFLLDKINKIFTL